MRGGAPEDDAIRGITMRDYLIWILYRSLARGDFHHDFGERTKTRDLIVKEDEKRFLEFAKNLTTKGNVWLSAQFANKLKDKTLYSLLGGSFDILVPRPMPQAPPGAPPVNDIFPDENSLIGSITGVGYEAIKGMAVVAQHPAAAKTLEFTVGGVRRSYTIRSSSYREGVRPTTLPKTGPAWESYKRNRNISTMFREVTGSEKTKFALIVDATGGLALTDILNASLNPQPEAACEFYIIQNIENASDSADKVQNMTVKSGPVGSPTASLFYLRDIGDTVVYPLWGAGELDQKSNIFASMQISLTRMKDGTVEADILANGQSFHIGDVANASNVKNASLAAAAILLEKGIVPEVFVYTLIKRMGDWCQALSMLDLDRVYNITNNAGVVSVQTTLRNMLVDTEIGVVTNDRILFAFCLLHGLNVFLTSAMDIARLIYFKNNNDLPAGPDLLRRANDIYAAASAQFVALRGAFDTLTSSLLGELGKKSETILTTTSLPEYLALVKEFTVIVSRLDSNNLLPFDAQPEKAGLDALSAQYKAAADAGNANAGFSIASQMTALGGKIQTRLTLGQQALDRLLTQQYPGKSVIDVRVAALASKLAQGGRAPNSVAIVEARDTLVRVREDVEMIMKNIPVLKPNLLSIFYRPFSPSPREEVNYGEVLKGLNPTRLVLGPPPAGAPPAGGGQRGGATINEVYNALRTRMIRLLPRDSIEVTSTTNTYRLGDDYIGEDMRAYTVVDEYIITKEDASTFAKFDERVPGDARMSQYINDRRALLQFDMLRQRYANFNDSFAESLAPYTAPDGTVDLERTNEIDIMEPGSQLYESIASIWNDLRAIVQALVPPDTPPLSESFPEQGVFEAEFTTCRELFISRFGAMGVISQDAVKAQRIATGINRYDDYYKSIAWTAVLPYLPGLVIVNRDGTQALTSLGQELLDEIEKAFLDHNDSDTFTEARSKVPGQIERVVNAVGKFVDVKRPTADHAPANAAAGRVKSVLTGQYNLQIMRETEAEAAAEAQAEAAVRPPPDEASMAGQGRRKTHRRRGLPKLV